MSFRFGDSFDHYELGTVGLARKWGQGGGAVVPGGRRGTQGLSGAAEVVLDDIEESIVGAAFFLNGGDSILGPGLGGDQAGNIMFRFSNDGIVYMDLSVSTDGRLRVTRGSYPQTDRGDISPGGGATALYTTGPNVFRFANWVHVAMKVDWKYAGGSVIVKVNNTTVINLPSVQTIPNNKSDDAVGFAINPEYITQVMVRAGGGIADDVYILDTEGDTNNDFLGDVEALLRLPDGAGLKSDSTIIGTDPEPTRWENERSADEEVSAVKFADEADRDSYTYEDIPYDAATVHAVQLVAQARKADNGTARITLTNSYADPEDESVEVDTVDALPVTLSPSAGEDMSFRFAVLDESAQGPWDLDKFNNAEFGVRRDT